MKCRKVFLVILLFLCVAIFSFAGGAGEKEVEEGVKPLKIGILGPMSGPSVAWGLPAKHGAEIWVEDIIAAGGIKAGGGNLYARVDSL